MNKKNMIELNLKAKKKPSEKVEKTYTFSVDPFGYKTLDLFFTTPYTLEDLEKLSKHVVIKDDLEIVNVDWTKYL